MQVAVRMEYYEDGISKWVDLNGNSYDIHNCRVIDILEGREVLVILPLNYEQGLEKPRPVMVYADTLNYFHGRMDVVYSIDLDVLEKEQ